MMENFNMSFRFTVCCDRDLYREFQLYCKNKDSTVSEEVRIFVEHCVKNPYEPNMPKGLSLRDYFASQSLRGIRAGKYKNGDKLWPHVKASKAAYDDADAMIIEREEESK